MDRTWPASTPTACFTTRQLPSPCSSDDSALQHLRLHWRGNSRANVSGLSPKGHSAAILLLSAPWSSERSCWWGRCHFCLPLRSAQLLRRCSDEARQIMDVDDLLPVVEAAALLSFVKSERGDMDLTPSGKAFAEADISTRKEVFREAALSHVTLLQQMNGALASKSDHTMPLELFRDILQEHFSDDDVQRQIDTA